jgi:hypothetical protein
MAALRAALHKHVGEAMRQTRTICSGAVPAHLAAHSRATAKAGRNQHLHGCPRKTGSAVSGRANHRDPVTPPHLPGGKPVVARLPAGSSVSTEQRATLDAVLRRSAFPAGSDVGERRRLLRELASAQPLPAY